MHRASYFQGELCLSDSRMGLRIVQKINAARLFQNNMNYAAGQFKSTLFLIAVLLPHIMLSSSTTIFFTVVVLVEVCRCATMIYSINWLMDSFMGYVKIELCNLIMAF